MKKEIKGLTQKDIDLHNETSKILGEEDNPEIDLRVGDSAGFEHSFNGDKGVKMITEKELPFSKEPEIIDGYRIAELVKILDNARSFFEVNNFKKPTIARILYPLLESYFVTGKNDYINAGLQIKINKQALDYDLVKNLNAIVNEENHMLNNNAVRLKDSQKLLHAKVIEKDKLIKKAIKLINIKDKTIIRLATRLVNKG